MRREKKANLPGMDPVPALALIFALLKARGRVSWPWLWVLSPVWLTFLFFAVILWGILVGGRIVNGKW